jgi:hypothetical protein
MPRTMTLFYACTDLSNVITDPALKPKSRILKLIKMKPNPACFIPATLLDCPVPGLRHRFPGNVREPGVQVWEPLNHPRVHFCTGALPLYHQLVLSKVGLHDVNALKYWKERKRLLHSCPTMYTQSLPRPRKIKVPYLYCKELYPFSLPNTLDD